MTGFGEYSKWTQQNKTRASKNERTRNKRIDYGKSNHRRDPVEYSKRRRWMVFDSDTDRIETYREKEPVARIEDFTSFIQVTEAQ